MALSSISSASHMTALSNAALLAITKERDQLTAEVALLRASNANGNNSKQGRAMLLWKGRRERDDNEKVRKHGRDADEEVQQNKAEMKVGGVLEQEMREIYRSGVAKDLIVNPQEETGGESRCAA